MKSLEWMMRRVRVVGDCWEWVGQVGVHGYGRVRLRQSGPNQSTMAHRLMYELVRGPIPAGFQIDHLCRNKVCVNPDHLEAVTARENCLRSACPPADNARKSHCIHGHPFSGRNLYTKPTGDRVCIACRGLREYGWTQARVASLLEPRSGDTPRGIGDGPQATEEGGAK